MSFGLDIVNALYARQTIERPDLEKRRLPFVKQFYGVIDAETDRLVGYQRLEAAEKVVEPIKRAMREGESAEVGRLLDVSGPIGRLGGVVDDTRRHLSTLLKAERAVIQDDKMPDDIKFARLQVLAENRRKVLQQFNRAYDQAIVSTTTKENTRP